MKDGLIKIQVSNEQSLRKIQQLFNDNPQDMEIICAEIHENKQRDKNTVKKLREYLPYLKRL